MKTQLTPAQKEELITLLRQRFERNRKRHPEIKWENVETRLRKNPSALWSLFEMENSEGEPDVIGTPTASGAVVFCDCAAESPAGRRSLCYDREGWESRKEHRPENSAMDVANEMGVRLMNEEEYRFLQTLGSFDAKTSSWLLTSEEVRKRGGAIFGDYRFGRVFVYHNGAQSYYAARGFRGILEV